MPKWTARRTPAAADERGVAAVEFALILPVLVLVMFGAITGGLAFSNAIGVTNAVREGARFAATTDMASGNWASTSLERIRETQLDDQNEVTTVCVQLVGATSVGPVCDDGIPSQGSFEGTIPSAGEGCVVLVWARRDFHVEMGVFGEIDGVIHREAASRYEREC